MRLRVPAALDLPDAPPIDRGRVAVLLVARDDAAFAADAFAHVEMEAVLLTWPRGTKGHSHGGLRGCRAHGRQHERDAIIGGASQER
jgi:hypothetical protein